MRKLIHIAIALALFVSCGSKHSVLSFENPVYVTEFMENSEITSSGEIKMDLLGAIDVKIKDSILLVSQQGAGKLMRAFRYPSMSCIGEYIDHGNGPGEQMFPFYFCNTAIKNDGDSLRLSVPVFNLKVINYSIPVMPTDSRMAFQESASDFGKDALGIFALDDSIVFFQSLSLDRLHMNRNIRVGNAEQSIPSLRVLDEAFIERNDGYSYNVMSVIPVYNPQDAVVAECCLAVNCINMYSLADSSFHKTIVIGKRQATVSESELRLRMTRELPQYCYYAVSYDDCFAVLFGDPMSKAQSVMIFDWAGNPIDKVDLPCYATTFDIDFERNILFTLNAENETMFMHHVSLRSH